MAEERQGKVDRMQLLFEQLERLTAIVKGTGLEDDFWENVGSFIGANAPKKWREVYLHNWKGKGNGNGD